LREGGEFDSLRERSKSGIEKEKSLPNHSENELLSVLSNACRGACSVFTKQATFTSSRSAVITANPCCQPQLPATSS
jgi:hypothetical protein